jgi:hypothetical protein
MAVNSRWRAVADNVIAKVVSDNPGLSEDELRKKLSDAYPFGMRKYHPYKIWLSAVHEHFSPRTDKRKIKAATVNEGQLLLSMEDEATNVD